MKSLIALAMMFASASAFAWGGGNERSNGPTRTHIYSLGMSCAAVQNAVAANGADTPDFFRLFMVPGMFHCRGGVGPDRLDGLTALINWVENGTAPTTITAGQMTDGKVTRTRPLCPYPQVARYSGTGNPDDAANFACKAAE